MFFLNKRIPKSQEKRDKTKKIVRNFSINFKKFFFERKERQKNPRHDNLLNKYFTLTKKQK